jgi:hypothetical protein
VYAKRAMSSRETSMDDGSWPMVATAIPLARVDDCLERTGGFERLLLVSLAG